jgi:hypothetical protein
MRYVGGGPMQLQNARKGNVLIGLLIIAIIVAAAVLIWWGPYWTIRSVNHLWHTNWQEDDKTWWCVFWLEFCICAIFRSARSERKTG